jgi:hypothetical protein
MRMSLLWLFWIGLFVVLPGMLLYLRIRHWWDGRRR